MKFKYFLPIAAIFLIALSIPISAQYLYCVDSDGGVNFNVAGSVDYSWVADPSPEEITTVSDYCSVEGSAVPDCAGDNCYIHEYFCKPKEAEFYLVPLEERCNSCHDGACEETVASCSDGIQNQDEEGVDCGGVCDPCDGAVPEVPEHCTNGVRDEDEMGIDCGGSCGATCKEGQPCKQDSDCASHSCIEDACAAGAEPWAHCTNEVQDVDEEGVDCGGAYCPPCELSSVTVEKGSNDPGDHNWSTTDDVYNVMLQLRVELVGETIDVLPGITLEAGGTGDDREDIEEILIAADMPADGNYTLGDDIFGRGTYDADNGTAEIAFDSTVHATESTMNYLIVYKMKTTPSEGETFTLQIARQDEGYYQNTKTVVVSEGPVDGDGEPGDGEPGDGEAGDGDGGIIGDLSFDLSFLGFLGPLFSGLIAILVVILLVFLIIFVALKSVRIIQKGSEKKIEKLEEEIDEIKEKRTK